MQTKKALETLGWQSRDPLSVETPYGLLSLLEGDADEQSAFDHFVRESLRFQVWAEADARREDMRGLNSPQGVDRAATTAMANKFKGEEKLFFINCSPGALAPGAE